VNDERQLEDEGERIVASILPAGMFDESVPSPTDKVAIGPIGVYCRSSHRILLFPMPAVPLENIQVAYEFPQGRDDPSSSVFLSIKGKPHPPLVANQNEDWTSPGFENPIEISLGLASDIDVKKPPMIKKKDGLLIVTMHRIPEEIRLLKAEVDNDETDPGGE